MCDSNGNFISIPALGQATPPNLSPGAQFSNVLDSASDPALTTFANRLVVAYVDDNTKHLFVSSASQPDASDVSFGVDTGLPARDVPAIAVYNNSLFIIYNNSSTGSLYVTQTSNGSFAYASDFTPSVPVNIANAGVQPQGGIGLQSINGSLYLSFLTNSGGSSVLSALSISSTDGVNLTGPTGPFENNVPANYGVSIATGSQGLQIATTDQDGNLVNGGGSSQETEHDSSSLLQLYLSTARFSFLEGTGRENHNLEEASLTGSNVYSGYYNYPQTISTEPGATVFNGRLFVAGRSDSNNHLLVFYADN